MFYALRVMAGLGCIHSALPLLFESQQINERDCVPMQLFFFFSFFFWLHRRIWSSWARDQI